MRTRRIPVDDSLQMANIGIQSGAAFVGGQAMECFGDEDQISVAAGQGGVGRDKTRLGAEELYNTNSSR